jgi:FixJ family two-component response regulator
MSTVSKSWSKLRAANREMPVIVLTAKGGIDSAVEAMRAGANDFLVEARISRTNQGLDRQCAEAGCAVG